MVTHGARDTVTISDDLTENSEWPQDISDKLQNVLRIALGKSLWYELVKTASKAAYIDSSKVTVRLSLDWEIATEFTEINDGE